MASKTTPGAQPSGKKSRSKTRNRRMWATLDGASRLAATFLAPSVSTAMWRIATGRRPPTSVRHPEVTTGEAVAWAALTGASVQVLRTVVRRSAATYWVRSTGELPPGMKHLADTKQGKASASKQKK